MRPNTSIFTGRCANHRVRAFHIGNYIPWFDYNKDLVVEELRDINTSCKLVTEGFAKGKASSKGLPKYSKDMPSLDKCLRMNGYYSTKQKERIVDTALSIIGKGNLPFTTGNNSTLDNQKMQYLQDWLGRVSQVMLHIHKLHIKTSVDKENYGILNLTKRGNAKVHFERIGPANGPKNVEYRIYTNGTIMIYITCTNNPFRLFREEDI